MHLKEMNCFCYSGHLTGHVGLTSSVYFIDGQIIGGPPAAFVQAGIGFFSFVNSWKPKNSFVNSWKRCCSWIVKRQNIVREFVKFEIFVREFVNSYTFVSCILTKSLHKIKKLSYPHFLDLINRLTSPDGNRIQIEATPIMKQLPHDMRRLWNYHWVHSCSGFQSSLSCQIQRIRIAPTRWRYTGTFPVPSSG